MLRADEHGITLSRDALRALLAFAAKEDPAERLDVIAIRVSGGEVTARASDGNAALTLTGPADGAEDGQWDIGLPFLRTCAKALGATDKARIEPHGATIRDATVMRQMEHGQDWEEAEALAFHYDAARTQRQFPWDSITEFGRRPKEPMGVVAFDAELMARLALVQKATGIHHCTMYLGDSDEAPMLVRCGEDAQAVVMPCRRDDKPRAKGEDPVEEAVRGLFDGLAEKGVTSVTVTGPNGVGVEVKPRGRKGRGSK